MYFSWTLAGLKESGLVNSLGEVQRQDTINSYHSGREADKKIEVDRAEGTWGRGSWRMPQGIGSSGD